MQTEKVLQTLRLPARLTAEQAGSLLGIHPDSVRFLTKAGLLQALGGVQDIQIFFATVYVRRLCVDEKWLSKATNAIRVYHKRRNTAQKSRRVASPAGV